MITYRELQPLNKKLLPYIKSYIQVSGEKKISREFLPQLGSTLVLDFDGNSLFDEQSLKMIVIAKHDQRFQFRTLSTDNDKLIIRLSPYGLSAFLKMPISEINNQFTNAEDIFGSGIRDLFYLLGSITSSIQRIELIEAFLLSKFNEPTCADKMIFSLADSIRDHADLPSLNILKSSMSLSVRQIERNFKKLIGTPISQYIRIIRFEKAKRLLEKKSFLRLTDVAYEAGYYDQSHFISDFKIFTGINPKQYTSC